MRSRNQRALLSTTATLKVGRKLDDEACRQARRPFVLFGSVVSVCALVVGVGGKTVRCGSLSVIGDTSCCSRTGSVTAVLQGTRRGSGHLCRSPFLSSSCSFCSASFVCASHGRQPHPGNTLRSTEWILLRTPLKRCFGTSSRSSSPPSPSVQSVLFPPVISSFEGSRVSNCSGSERS